MYKKLIKKCKYAECLVTHKPLYCDVYVIIDNGEMLWHENLFLSYLARTMSVNTLRSYATDLLSFTKAVKHIGGWKEVSQSQITGYLHGELFQNRNYSLASMMRHTETLKHFYNWLYIKGYIDAQGDFDWSYKHLFTKFPSINTAHNKTQHSFNSLYVDSATYEKLLGGVVSKNLFIQARDNLVLRLGYECGTRSFEIHNLNVEKVREKINEAKDRNKGLWGTTRIRLIGKGAKSRELYLPPSLCEIIMDYINRFRLKLNNGHGPLICNRRGLALKNEKHASTVFANACRQALIKRFHTQGYHRLRKSFGTNLVNECYLNGGNPWVEVPRRLGHKDFETTKLYIQFDALRNDRSRVLNELSMMSKKRYRGIQGGID